MQSYLLDTSTLLQILSRQKRTGTLRADLRLPREGEAHAYLEIENGVLRACTLLTNARVLAEGKEAMQILSDLGVQEWRWASGPPIQQSRAGVQESSLVFLPLAQPAGDPAPCPQRIDQVNARRLDALSRIHRRIFALSDGTRSPEKIAAMLSMNLADLYQRLGELEAWRLITYRSPFMK